MTKLLACVALCQLVYAPAILAGEPAASAATVGQALQRTIPLLQQADQAFQRRSGCVSCHHNALTAMTVATARRHRVRIDEALARKQASAMTDYLEARRERFLQGTGLAAGAGAASFLLVALDAANRLPDVTTDVIARHLLSQQSLDGGWRRGDPRAPCQTGDATTTAMAVRAIYLFAPAAQMAERDRAIRRAGEWLMQAPLQSTEDRAFQLLGLAWANRPAWEAVIQTAAVDLLGEQRADGGWAQLPSLPSDALATGQALVALREAGVPVNNPAYQRGARFLVDTQRDDGSWFVKTRAVPQQPQFNSGFPHGPDQWISAAATSWAAMALAPLARTRR